jgi:farnesyl-diphosphate farnesyltransferase
MARWVLRGPDIQTEADLDDYMHEVAGRVGYLITELFSLASPTVSRNRQEMMALGQEFGLALQTVNVVRGIPADIERGWFFVPRDFLPDPITDGRAFLEPARREDAVRIIDRLLEKATGHFAAAQRYIELLPPFKGRLRYFCLLPYFFGVRTLALSRQNPDVLVSEVKLARDEVRAIAGKSRLLGWSNSWIRRYAGALQKRPRT